MTDAQWLIDSARKHLNDAAAELEHHFDSVAAQLRDFLSTETPLMKHLRPAPPPPPPSTYETCIRWIASHRRITAAVVAFAVTGAVGSGVYLYTAKKTRKRRAARSTSGARTEVVVLAGAITSPLASNLALDLERRGFIVYTVVGESGYEESFIRGLQRADLLPLPLHLSDAYTAAEQISRFRTLLDKSHSAFDTADPHKLCLKALILVPDTDASPARSIDDISSEDWSDALNTQVLQTIATTQLLLPLLTSHSSRILLLTPNIASALRLPGHAVENTTHAALDAFATTLAAELKASQSPVAITRFKLGSLDIPSRTATQRRDGVASTFARPTPLRALHDRVFDALVSRRAWGMCYVGRGSRAYDLIGALAPAGLVARMMSLKQPGKANLNDARSLAIEGSSTWERVEKDV